MDDAAAEPVLVDGLEIDACVGRQCGGAPTEGDWPDDVPKQVPGDQHPAASHLIGRSDVCEELLDYTSYHLLLA